MTTTDLSTFIKEQALKLGFDACGIARAEMLNQEECTAYHSWLYDHCHGKMHYMEKNLEKRLNPGLLVKNCRSIVVVALNYSPSEVRNIDTALIARFAYGKDYHGIIRGKLQSLLQRINEQGVSAQGRAFSDSAPVAERYWAWKSGLGWRGKNNLLILPQKGSYFLLGELLLDLELESDFPMPSLCGSCNRCLQACPTNALTTCRMDAKRCLSYLTIENRCSFDLEEAKIVGENDWIFGCDICQEVCPWNRFATPHKTPEFEPSPDFLRMTRSDLEAMDEKSFHQTFQGSCMQRAGVEGLRRNLKAQKETRPSIG
jgi:epoxyqueuosine reductase